MALKGYSAVLTLLTLGLVLVNICAMPELNPDHDLRIWMDRMEKGLELSLKQSEKVEKENRDLKSKVADLEQELTKQKERLAEQEKEIKRLSSKKLRKRKQITHNIPSKYSIDVQMEAFTNPKPKRNDDLDLAALQPVVAGISQKLEQMTADMQAFKNQATARPTGTTFVRWGNGQCSNTSEIVYSGTAGGGWYDSYGSAANFLCLPHHPTFDSQDKAVNTKAGLWGAEYNTHPDPTQEMTPLCAVCRASRASTVMVPATHSCEAGWTLEYSGYLMTGYPGHKAASEYICVDGTLGYREETRVISNGKLLYYTTARCGALTCPPYVEGRLIRCAVCSK